jgi:hypothetical protein
VADTESPTQPQAAHWRAKSLARGTRAQEVLGQFARQNSTHPVEPVGIDGRMPPGILNAVRADNHKLGGVRVMAIYIQIRKTDEFGPSEGFIGTVFVERATRDVSLLHIDDPNKQEFYFSRVRRALQRHLESSEFPASTCYTA